MVKGRAVRIGEDGVLELLRDAVAPRMTPGTVTIQVQCAGICRTDLYVAERRLAAGRSLTLGHEFSGVVVGTAGDVARVRTGMRVAVMPFLRCDCSDCDASARGVPCFRAPMLGVHRDGAFADFITVPAEIVYPVSEKLSDLTVAYAEPIAATLAVLPTVDLARPVLVLGSGRITELTVRVLCAAGAREVRSAAVDAPEECAGSIEQIIETDASAEAIQRALDLIRPRGVLVMKSRRWAPTPIMTAAIVQKEIAVRGAYYAPFSQAIEFLESELIELSDLMGPTWRLEEFQEAFSSSGSDERQKHFFIME